VLVGELTAKMRLSTKLSLYIFVLFLFKSPHITTINKEIKLQKVAVIVVNNRIFSIISKQEYCSISCIGSVFPFSFHHVEKEHIAGDPVPGKF
jgi:hypothetical protein